MVQVSGLSHPNKDGATVAAQQRPPTSLCMIVSIIFVTHGFVNSVLLFPWNTLRCAYWNMRVCTESQDWIMDNLAWEHLSVFLLLACLSRTAMGDVVLERRLSLLIGTILLSNLSSGVYLLKYANRSMLGLQCIIYVGLLVPLLWNLATAVPISPVPLYKLRSSSFDHRKRLPIPTVAITFNFFMRLFRLIDIAFGSGREVNSSSAIFQIISETATNQSLWVTLILGMSIVLATPQQHRLMLLGHSMSCFVGIILLSGSYGSRMEDPHLKSNMIGTFLGMMISLVGCY